jgi:septal ring factor EnvC (AmiA/AmiB activator)
VNPRRLARALPLALLLLPAPRSVLAGPLTELAELQAAIVSLQEEELRLAQRVGELDQLLLATESRLQQEEEEVRALGGRLRRHVLALDRLGRSGSLALLALAPSVRELHRREALLRHALRAERRLLVQAAAASQELARAREEASRVREEAASALNELRGKQRTLQQEVRRRHELVRAVHADPRAAQSTAQELDASARALRELIDSAAGGATDRWVPFEGRKGQLGPPVAGRLQLNFGVRRHPLIKTEVRHLGVDFLAPTGTPVVGVHPGVVVHAGDLPGYGGVVILAHGQGYHTVYAQLQGLRVEVGQVVASGTPLGEVGPDPLDDPAHLHFEVRNRGRALDPKEWLAR